MNNQQGFTALGAALLLLVASMAVLLALKLGEYHHKKLRGELKQYLCLKEYNGLQYKHHFQISSDNLKIHALNAAIAVALASVSGAGSVPYLRNLKKLVQYQQNFNHALYIRSIYRLKNKKCLTRPWHLRNSYTSLSNPFVLKRSLDGTAIKRHTQWQHIFKYGKEIIWERFNGEKKLTIKYQKF